MWRLAGRGLHPFVQHHVRPGRPRPRRTARDRHPALRCEHRRTALRPRSQRRAQHRARSPVPSSDNQPLFAQAAIGQGRSRSTPLEMALVAESVATGGVILEPHVVARIEDADGNVVAHDPAEGVAAGDDPATAATMKRLHVAGRATRYGNRRADPRSQVAGKTGTAETRPVRTPTPGSSPSRRPIIRSTRSRCSWSTAVPTVPRKPPAARSPHRSPRRCSARCSGSNAMRPPASRSHRRQIDRAKARVSAPCPWSARSSPTATRSNVRSPEAVWPRSTSPTISR